MNSIQENMPNNTYTSIYDRVRAHFFPRYTDLENTIQGENRLFLELSYTPVNKFRFGVHCRSKDFKFSLVEHVIGPIRYDPDEHPKGSLDLGIFIFPLSNETKSPKGPKRYYIRIFKKTHKNQPVIYAQKIRGKWFQEIYVKPTSKERVCEITQNCINKLNPEVSLESLIHDIINPLGEILSKKTGRPKRTFDDLFNE